MSNEALDPNVILSSEFGYAAQTALQAHEDRARVYNYFLTAVVTLLAGAVLMDPANRVHLAALGLGFSGLAVLGFFSMLNVAKLRLAWRDSVSAMCQIKDYYIERCEGAELTEALRWTTETIPPASKKWTVAFLVALTLIILNSVSLAGAVLLLAQASTGASHVLVSIIVGVVFLVGQVGAYTYLTGGFRR
jgi:hypothetical protein